VHLLRERADDTGARRVGEPLQLREALLEGPTPAASVDAHQDGALLGSAKDLFRLEPLPAAHLGAVN
jgi:hypothetical protein